MRLEASTVLVMAAVQGIGRVAALALTAQGVRVIATDLKADLRDYCGAHGAGQAVIVDGGVTI